MRKSKFTDDQIAFVLKPAEQGASAPSDFAFELIFDLFKAPARSSEAARMNHVFHASNPLALLG